MACAIVGDQIGYWIGRKLGPALYKKEDSLLFRRSHLQRAHEFYEKYGGRAVILARFVPIVRTFCPPVTGAAAMPYSRYLLFDIFGGILWVGTMILGGFFLGPLGSQHRAARSLRDRRRCGAIDSAGRHRRAAIAQSRDTAGQPRVAVASRKSAPLFLTSAAFWSASTLAGPRRRSVSSLSLSPAEVWTAIEKDPRWPDWQEGRMSARDWHLHLSRKLGTALTFEQFTDAWNQALDPRAVARRCTVRGPEEELSPRTCFRIPTPFTWPTWKPTSASSGTFPRDRASIPVESAASKPNPVIYGKALRACKAKADEAVYHRRHRRLRRGRQRPGFGWDSVRGPRAAARPASVARR